MIRLVSILVVSLLVGCVSAPERTVLLSENPADVTVERNWPKIVWEELKEHVDLTRDKKLKWSSKTGRYGFEIGRVRTISPNKARLADKANPDGLKKRWGIKFIYRFKEWLVI